MPRDDTTLEGSKRVAVPGGEPALTVLFSPDRAAVGRTQALAGGALSIGRGVGIQGLRFDDPRASRDHAVVERDPARAAYVVRDTGSRNGTRLNGREVRIERVEAGDIIRVGDTVLAFSELDLATVGWRSPPGCSFAGASPALRRLLDDIAKVAPTDLAVLVVGATGTGKELAAQELHRQSGRGGGFVALNCAAIPPDLLESELFGHARGAFSGADRPRSGLFREAAGGTLFLDEVGELRADHQAKLLRVLQDKIVRPAGAERAVVVDVRVVAATQVDLYEQPTFRRDLLARLDGWTLALRPLAERLEDILPITEQALVEHGGAVGYRLTGELFEALALHDWPLNVRELLAAIRHAMLAAPPGGILRVEHLPRRLRRGEQEGPPERGRQVTLPPRGVEPTPAELEALLAHYRGSVADIARHTGRERTQVYRWLSRHGLDPSAYRGV